MSSRVSGLSALVVALVGFAATAATAAPVIQIEPKQIDLGVIQEGNLFERFIEITNAGDGTLVIQDVKTSCGCTAAAVDGIVELDAGEKQKVRVTFDSKGMDGSTTKKVTVSSNDETTPQKVVYIKADVHRPIRWEPKYVSLNRVGIKDGFEQEVKLQSDNSLGLEVKAARILGGTLRDEPSKLLTLTAGDPYMDGDRKVHPYKVVLNEGARPQRVSETIEIVTNQSAPHDTLKLAVRGEITGRIRVLPNFCVLRLVESGQETSRDVTLTATDGTFQVLSAEVPKSTVTTEIIPNEDGRQTVVRLSYVGEEPGSTGVRKLKIETDDPDQRFIELSVRYQTRGEAPASTPNPSTAQTNNTSSQGPK